MNIFREIYITNKQLKTFIKYLDAKQIHSIYNNLNDTDKGYNMCLQNLMRICQDELDKREFVRNNTN